MKKEITLVSTLALLILFTAAVPVMACHPKTTYTFGAVGYDIPNTGTTFFSAHNTIEHGRNHLGVAFDFGHPWGPGVGTTTTDLRLNVDENSPNAFRGYAVTILEAAYATGTLEQKNIIKCLGLGYYSYHGPTLTKMLPAPWGSVIISDGDTFFGILMTGRNEGHGTFVDGKVKVLETLTGVIVLAGPLAGINVISGTGTSMV